MLDRARETALYAAEAEVRPALRALWEIDLAFEDVVATTLTPQLGEIRMAWWRERLEDLDREIEPPAEPRLQAVAATLIPRGISGAELSRLEDCWFPFLAPQWSDEQVEALSERGAILFGIGARLLGRDPHDAEALGRLWSLADAAQYLGDEKFRGHLARQAKVVLENLPNHRVSVGLGSLGMIAGKRTYDLLHGHRSKWHRLVWAIRYSVSRRIPR